MPTPIPPFERFIAKVIKTDTCWIWTGVTGGKTHPYGYFRPGTKSTDPKVPAHRFSYEHFVGPIPPGLEIDHVAERGCTSRLCVNPEHLEPVSPKENSRRKRLTVCRSGKHDLTDPQNVTWDERGRRRGCIQCKRERALAGYYRNKEST